MLRQTWGASTPLRRTIDCTAAVYLYGCPRSRKVPLQNVSRTTVSEAFCPSPSTTAMPRTGTRAPAGHLGRSSPNPRRRSTPHHSARASPPCSGPQAAAPPPPAAACRVQSANRSRPKVKVQQTILVRLSGVCLTYYAQCECRHEFGGHLASCVFAASSNNTAAFTGKRECSICGRNGAALTPMLGAPHANPVLPSPGQSRPAHLDRAVSSKSVHHDVFDKTASHVSKPAPSAQQEVVYADPPKEQRRFWVTPVCCVKLA